MQGPRARSLCYKRPPGKISAESLHKISIRGLLARSHIFKTVTAPQREQSDMHKALRRLRGRSQNLHRATEVMREWRERSQNEDGAATRAIRHQVPRLPRKKTFKTKPPLILTHVCQSKAQKAPRPPHGWKRVRCPAHVAKKDVLDFKMSHMSHACHEKHCVVNIRCLRECQSEYMSDRVPNQMLDKCQNTYQKERQIEYQIVRYIGK